MAGIFFLPSKTDSGPFNAFAIVFVSNVLEAIPFMFIGALAIALDSKTAKAFEKDQWVRVEGLFRLVQIDGKPVPFMEELVIIPPETPAFPSARLSTSAPYRIYQPAVCHG